MPNTSSDPRPDQVSDQVVELPVLWLDDEVILPGMVAPIALDAGTQAAVDAARNAADSRLLIVPRNDGAYASHGVLAVIEQVGRLPQGGQAVVVRGVQRARIGAGVSGAGAALWVQATLVEDSATTPRTAELAADYRALVISILQLRGAYQVIDTVQRVNDAATLSDLAGYASYLDTEQKLWLLETADVDVRLEKLSEWARAQLAELEVSGRIRDEVREGMEKTQREFLLRQQLAAIRKELGEGEPDGADDYRARVEEADLPEKVRDAALREVGKLERGSDQSPEAGWIRTWLDTVLELPWNTRTQDSTDITAARAILDADHEGLDDVKDRIVEHLAVRARRAERGLELVGGRGSGAVLALVGPPGVGKTSLGESVARALDRKFVRVALGGVRDEAEIRGHRRTYVGALPGRIVRAIREAGSMNPVVLLDEVDKIGSDYRGDPASALLEVLDPAQNHTFRDHYLELELDLSDVLVPGDRERAGDDPRRVARPHGGRAARRLHRGREGRHCAQPLAATAIVASSARLDRGRRRRRGAAPDRRRAHPRSRCAPARTGDRTGAAQGRDQDRGCSGERAGARHRFARSLSFLGDRGSLPKAPNAPPSPVLRPVLP